MPDNKRAKPTRRSGEAALAEFDARLRALGEREAARDRDLARQREELDGLRRENGALRRELTEVKLTAAVLGQQVQGYPDGAQRADDELWRAIYACLAAIALFGALVGVLVAVFR